MAFSKGDRVRILRGHPYEGKLGTCTADEDSDSGTVHVRIDQAGGLTALTKDVEPVDPPVPSSVVYGDEPHGNYNAEKYDIGNHATGITGPGYNPAPTGPAE